MDIKKENKKFYRSKVYNYIFNRENGFFIRWGKNFEIIKFRIDLLNNNRNCLNFKIYELERGYNIC